MEVRTYQATANLVWVRSYSRVVIGHTTTPPANTATPVGWFEACTPNGSTIGRVPLYQ